MTTVVGQRRLTLSFDNGPNEGGTEAILDCLRRRGLRATFFVVGESLRHDGGRQLVQQAHDDGHWIGNHTLNHGPPLGAEAGADYFVCEREIGRMQTLLNDLAHPDRLFRPNGKGKLGPHLLSPAAVEYLTAHRFTVVTWNNVPRDWEAPQDQWVGRALDTLSRQDWSLLVVHDKHIRHMPKTLDLFLDQVADTDVEIVQEFPPACVAMYRGKPTAAMTDISLMRRLS